MGFKDVLDLDADVTVALGGRDKKTGKPNPTKVEGYYLGAKKVESKLARSGYSFIHIFQTPKGNIGVWGKTDLDRKMGNVTPGVMVRVTHTGTTPTPRGEMHKYRVEFDADNSIEVNIASGNDTPAEEIAEEEVTSFADDGVEETDAGDEEQALDEAPPVRATPLKQVAATPDAVRQAKVKALLANGRAKTTG